MGLTVTTLDFKTLHGLGLTNLTRRTTYNYQVVARDSLSREVRSGILSFTTLKGKPSKIASLAASAGSVILSWVNPTDDPFFKGVAILRSTSGFISTYQAQSEIHRTNSTTINTWTDTTATTPGQAYYYTLFAYDDQNEYSDPQFVGFTVPNPQSNSTPTPVPPPSPTPATGGGGGGGGGGGPSATPFPVPTPSPIISVTAAKSTVKPSDFNLREGDTVSAVGSNDPDIYIINDYGYKRLFLNPIIFSFYGHLGGFQRVKTIIPNTRDIFPSTQLFRNCETSDPMVYALNVTGEDTGTLHHLNMAGDQAILEDPEFFKKVFCINNNEFNWYSKASAFTSLSQVPIYVRR